MKISILLYTIIYYKKNYVIMLEFQYHLTKNHQYLNLFEVVQLYEYLNLSILHFGQKL